MYASSLRVPRRYVCFHYLVEPSVIRVNMSIEFSTFPFRPQWNAGMSVEELDDNERQSFLMWRRSLARLSLLHLYNIVS